MKRSLMDLFNSQHFCLIIAKISNIFIFSCILSPIQKRQNEFTEEIEIISVINDDEEDTDEFNLERRQKHYYISPKTKVIFLARRYRFVFVLDLSPSLASGVGYKKKKIYIRLKIFFSKLILSTHPFVLGYSKQHHNQ